MVPLFDGYQKVWVRGKLWIADLEFPAFAGSFSGPSGPSGVKKKKYETSPTSSLATPSTSLLVEKNRLTLVMLHIPRLARLFLGCSCCRYRPWNMHSGMAFHGEPPRGTSHVVREPWRPSCRSRLKWIRLNFHLTGLPGGSGLVGVAPWPSSET